MWRSRIEELSGRRGRRVVLLDRERVLRYEEVLRLLRLDAAFRDHFIELLAAAPYAAYYWETPPIDRGCAGRPFEQVLIDAPPLAGAGAESGPFEQHFARATDPEGIAVFPNLGADATLVAPAPRAPEAAYPHLASFSRGAPAAQQHALWGTVGETVERSLSDHLLWLSTAGGGVYWLHIRLDSYPKYYSHTPYRRFG